MNLHWIVLGTLVTLVASAPESRVKPSTVTTETLVAKYGYPFEEHTVETEDGYILALHRIPYSPKVNNTSTDEARPVVFLMHGFLSSSSDFVVLGSDSALAFLLADAGYDVWMGNARGNVYSRHNINYSPKSKRFWDFEWHQIAMYDLPAMIEYICDTTGEEQVTYIGHSQGTTTFLVLNSLDTEFKQRIKSAHLMAPVAYMKHMQSPILNWSSLVLGLPNTLPELFGSTEFMPSSRLLEILGYTACTEASPVNSLCSNAFFLIGGYDYENLNEAKLPDIVATNPAGSSVNQLYHFLQEKNSGRFCQFDFGFARNLITYGSVKPPKYPLDKIDAPIYLYYGKNDYLADEVDVERLIKELPESSLKQAYLVPNENWNHFDFLWGLNVQEQVYDTLMENLAADK